jgi:hypothetical protein
VTEPEDQFAGASARSTKHNPRVDEELEHEIQGMLKAEHASGVRSSLSPRATPTSPPIRPGRSSAECRWA